MHCVVQGVVQSYPEYGGEAAWYRPEYAVTRDQMAVYIARAFQLPV